MSGNGPLYQRLYGSIRAAIHDGRVPAGMRLPSTRTMSDELGVSRKVVLMAFARLRLEGYVGARVGSGTYVTGFGVSKAPGTDRSRSAPPARVRLSGFGRRLLTRSDLPGLALQPPRTGLRYDFRFGVPDPELDFDAVWHRLLTRTSRRRGFGYAPSAGSPALRSAIVEYVAQSRGVVTNPEQVIIVNGAQQGLDLVARLLIDPGDRVAVDRLHYRGARDAFRAAGARIVALPMDDDGLITARLPGGARRVRLLYTTPSHQFPTGAILPLERRLELLRWADRTNASVVEDDYDAEFRYGLSPVEPLKALDSRDRVIYIGTFSKLLFPALRLGYVIVPPAMVGVFRAAKWLADRHTPLLEQEVLAAFIADGHLARHARAARIRYDARRKALLAALERTFRESGRVQGGRAGLHVLLWLPDIPARRLAELRQRAYDAHVGIDTLESSAIRPPRVTGLLVGYQGITQDRIDEGICCLAAVLADLRKATVA